MPSTPGTILFPAQLDDVVSLIQASNNAATVLSASATSGDTTLTVTSTTTFPATGSLTIEGEVIFYTGKTSTTFTGCLRGQDGTTAASHASAVAVEELIVAAYHNVQSSALIAVETKLGSTSSTPGVGLLLQGTGSGTSAWANQIGVGVAPATTRILNVAGTFSASSGQLAGAWIAPSFTSFSTNELYGLHLVPSYAATSAGAQVNFYALNSDPNVDSSATSNITSFANVITTFQQNSSTSVVGTYRGFFARNPTGSGAVSNVYGVYVEAMTKGTTSNYGVYAAGGLNYFAGATGIGVAPSNAAGLNLAATFTDPSVTTVYGLDNATTINLSSAPGGTWVGYGNFTSLTLSSSSNVTTLYGNRVGVVHGGAGTVTNHIGLSVVPSCNSTSGTAASTNVTSGSFGLSKSASGAWTIGTAKLLEVTAPNLSVGTITGTTLYGLYMEDLSGSVGTWTNKYALYLTGGTSYHAGSFGIGTNAPNSALHVAGSLATNVSIKASGSSYTLTASDNVVVISASGTFTLTLPTAVGITGRRYTLKKTSNSTSVTIATTSSQTIDGAAPVAMSGA